MEEEARKEREEKERFEKEEREKYEKEQSEMRERSTAKQRQKEEEIERRIQEEREAVTKDTRDVWRKPDVRESNIRRGTSETDSWRRGGAGGGAPERTEEAPAPKRVEAWRPCM